MELGIVGPAVDDQGRQEFQIQPQVEPIFGGFVAKVVHGAGLVQSSVDLTSSIARNCEKNYSKLLN